jgi:hypothetical protein
MNKFIQINDFDYFINPRDADWQDPIYKNLINKYFDFEKDENGLWFKNKKDLILCLIEIVTLNDSNAIGSTLLRSKMQKQSVVDFITKYDEIVKKVKNNQELVDGISKYNEWYHRAAYILLKSNDLSYSDDRISDWRTSPTIKSVNDRPRELYAQLKDSLTEEQIEKYLSYYSAQLSTELEFDKYPNTCVIVKPISVNNGQEYIPLGNLYMHFATLKPKNKHFYIKFLNSFMRVWFQENGFNVITEISEYNIKKEKEKVFKDFQEKVYVPNFNQKQQKKLTDRKLANNKNIEDYYNELYLNIERKEKFENKLDKIAKEVIYVFSKSPVNKKHNFTSISSKYTYRKGALNTLKNKECYIAFENILIVREIYKIGILLFDFEPKLFLDCLKGNSALNIDVIDTSYITSNSCATFLWIDRFLPSFIKKDDLKYKKTEIKSNIQNSLCLTEKSYIAKYREILTDIKKSN